MKRFPLLGVALIACGLILGGCGGDDDDADVPAATTATQTATQEQAIGQTVEGCKQGVRTGARQLSDDLRGDLEEICEQSVEGDPEDVRRATLDICKRIAEESVPAGPAREQAEKTCERSVPAP